MLPRTPLAAMGGTVGYTLRREPNLIRALDHIMSVPYLPVRWKGRTPTLAGDLHIRSVKESYFFLGAQRVAIVST